MEKINRDEFDVSEPSGLKSFKRFFDTLLEYNKEEGHNDYYDIHIKQEESYIIVEWVRVPYNHDWGGEFKYLDSYQYVMEEVRFPDDHYEMLEPSEIEGRLKEWHREHPEWVETYYGTWTNLEENRRSNIEYHLKEWLEKEEDEKDSTFKIIEGKDWLNDTITQILDKVGIDVVRRTNYLVIGNNLLTNCTKDRTLKIAKEFKCDYEVTPHVLKVGVLKTSFTYQDPWMKEEEDLDVTIHIYYSQDCENNMLYLTDSHCVIAKEIFKGEN